jgi:hypothetical protein
VASAPGSDGRTLRRVVRRLVSRLLPRSMRPGIGASSSAAAAGHRVSRLARYGRGGSGQVVGAGLAAGLRVEMPWSVLRWYRAFRDRSTAAAAAATPAASPPAGLPGVGGRRPLSVAHGRASSRRAGASARKPLVVAREPLTAGSWIGSLAATPPAGPEVRPGHELRLRPLIGLFPAAAGGGPAASGSGDGNGRGTAGLHDARAMATGAGRRMPGLAEGTGLTGSATAAGRMTGGSGIVRTSGPAIGGRTRSLVPGRTPPGESDRPQDPRVTSVAAGIAETMRVRTSYTIDGGNGPGRGDVSGGGHGPAVGGAPALRSGGGPGSDAVRTESRRSPFDGDTATLRANQAGSARDGHRRVGHGSGGYGSGGYGSGGHGSGGYGSGGYGSGGHGSGGHAHGPGGAQYGLARAGHGDNGVDPLATRPAAGPDVRNPYPVDDMRVLGAATLPPGSEPDPSGAVTVSPAPAPRPGPPSQPRRGGGDSSDPVRSGSGEFTPRQRWEASVALRPLEAPRPLPAAFHAMATAITGRARPPLFTTGPATRTALAAAGALGATTGTVVHLPAAPTAAPAVSAVLAHELTHTRSPVRRPRFLLDGASGLLDDDERQALAAGREKLSGATGAGIVDSLPVGGGMGAVGEVATRAARAAVLEATASPIGSALGGLSSFGGGIAADATSAAGGTARSAGDAASGMISAVSETATDAMSAASGAASGVAGAVGGVADAARTALDPDKVVEIVEQRLLREIERRGGRWAGVF